MNRSYPPRQPWRAIGLMALLGAGPGAMAAGTGQGAMDHGHPATPRQADIVHEAHRHATPGTYMESGVGQALKPLKAIPPSGRAREAGFDGRYGIEPTSAEYDLATLCAEGSRGLIMLDNATWARCGGKPKGAAKGAGYYPPLPPWNKAGTGQTHSMDHSMMGH